MRAGLILPPLYAAISVIPASAAPRAVEVQKNIFLVNDDGIRTQITSAGTDLQPDLALDGTKVVFVRKINQVEDEIYLADVREPHSPRSLLKSPVTINGRKFSGIFTPKFSPDGASVYFLVSPFSDGTNAIIRVSINSPGSRFIATALSFSFVKKGPYRGDLVANVRKPTLGYGYYDCFWVLSPEGKEIGVVGSDQRAVDFFLDLQE